MITEAQQEQASLYVLGTLGAGEQRAFEAELRANHELRELVLGLQRAAGFLGQAGPQHELPRGLKDKVFARIAASEKEKSSPLALNALAGLRFADAHDDTGWKALPLPGAFIKLLSLERERGYAVLMGKLDAGVRYPAHVNAGPEDFYIVSGDLVVGDRKLRAGDFHHADGGSKHEVNYSVEGCTLLAVLTVDDPLVEFAMA